MIYAEIIMLVLLIIMLGSDLVVMIMVNKRLNNCNKCYKEKYDVSKRKEVLEKWLKENEDE